MFCVSVCACVCFESFHNVRTHTYTHAALFRRGTPNFRLLEQVPVGAVAQVLRHTYSHTHTHAETHTHPREHAHTHAHTRSQTSLEFVCFSKCYTQSDPHQQQQQQQPAWQQHKAQWRSTNSRTRTRTHTRTHTSTLHQRQPRQRPQQQQQLHSKFRLSLLLRWGELLRVCICGRACVLLAHEHTYAHTQPPKPPPQLCRVVWINLREEPVCVFSCVCVRAHVFSCSSCVSCVSCFRV